MLTANQVRLVLELGGLFGHRVSVSMGKEIAATVGAGLGMRSLARQVLGVIPVGGWVAKGALAYIGTLAIGQAAVEYFSRPGLDRDAAAKITEIVRRIRRTGAGPKPGGAEVKAGNDGD